jgi:hypothetical protein
MGLNDVKRRFRSAKVTSSNGEDCVTCAVVDGPVGAIDVHYDRKNGITMVVSHDPKSMDVAGNKVGGLLATAIGNAAFCESGMETICTSTKIIGLSYIVADDEKCIIETATEKKSVAVPACAKIGGFQLWKAGGRL